MVSSILFFHVDRNDDDIFVSVHRNPPNSDSLSKFFFFENLYIVIKNFKCRMKCNNRSACAFYPLKYFERLSQRWWNRGLKSR